VTDILFHLDENVDTDLAKALRRHGIDVTTSQEQGLRTREDAAQLEFIRRQGRAIITHDPDFLRFASQGVEHPGIIFCEQQSRSIGQMVRALILIHEIVTAEEMVGRVQFI